jgi:hypothetical protein
VESVAQGKCVIMFLRRTEHIDEPFYTVQLRDGEIQQARGYDNGARTPEVEKFLALWERKVLQKQRAPKAA